METANPPSFLDGADVDLIREWAPKTIGDFLPLPDGRTPYPSGYRAASAVAELEKQSAWFLLKSNHPDAKPIGNRLADLAARVRARI